MPNEPYTYLIGWSKLNIYYYGVRYSKKSNPTELWVKYFTSSKHVKEFRLKNGEPDIIQVRKIFDNAEAAQQWEFKVLRRMKVVDDNRFLNKTNRPAPPPMRQKYMTEERRRKTSNTLKGRVFTEEHARNHSIAQQKRQDIIHGKIQI